MDNFLFVDLAMTKGKPIDYMAVGTFTDMRRNKATFTKSDLQEYIANAQAVIESTKTESGEIVGLPIDKGNHDHKGGAGWITGFSLQGNRVLADVSWTEGGKALIESGEMRFFSPSVDPNKKVPVGGSLTNWPASRDENYRHALRPIELESPVMQIVEDESPIETIVQFMKSYLSKEPKQEPIKENKKMFDIAELQKDPEAAAKLTELVNAQASARVAELLELEQRKAHIVEFAAKVTGGTADAPRGLPVAKDALVEFLSSLDKSAQEKAEGIFQTIVTSGMIDFAEKGHAGKRSDLEDLPKEYAAKLDSGEMTIADLSAPMLALGDLSQYDLSKWTKENK